MKQNELFGGFSGVKAVDEIKELEETMEGLLEISPGARGDALYALLSGLLHQGEVLCYLRKVLAAAEQAGGETGAGRRAAEAVRQDTLDPSTGRVRGAAWKTAREFDRLKGLLRFSRDQTGRYVARCAPDHFVLPLLGDHFFRRFGESSWAVVDEKRGVLLIREGGRPPELFLGLGGPGRSGGIPGVPPDEASGRSPAAAAGSKPFGRPSRRNAGPRGSLGEPDRENWEKLWQSYHRAVSNGDRVNPELQRRFMPRRYWKYLPEMSRGSAECSTGSQGGEDSPLNGMQGVHTQEPVYPGDPLGR
ncbi:MAG: DUF4130 domain-containing protein [Treponema sp.]|jgi:hypothetical protein|nr:DUF4130 domain-containing protein [Treponema sp.]